MNLFFAQIVIVVALIVVVVAFPLLFMPQVAQCGAVLGHVYT